VDAIEKAREAAIRGLARDLRVDFEKAERWCDAWERFAKRHGVAWNPYFWDSARGWIDAQRSMGKVVGPVERPRSRGVAR
jgi:hypothetical protein